MSEKPNLISLKEEIPATTFVHWANLTCESPYRDD